MRTVCAGGWGGLVHPEVVLYDDGPTNGLVSHGMCANCQRAVEQEEMKMAIRVRDQSWPRVFELLEEIRDAVVSKRRLTGIVSRLTTEAADVKGPKKKPPGRTRKKKD